MPRDLNAVVKEDTLQGMSELTKVMGEVAIEQGRLDDQGEDLRSLDRPDGVVRTKSNSSASAADEKDEEDDSDEEEEEGRT